MKTIILNQDKGYSLNEEISSGDLYIEVLVGGVGMYEVSHKLSNEEIDQYKGRGQAYLDELALNIQKYS